MGAKAEPLKREQLLPEYNRQLKEGKSVADIIKILMKKSDLSKIEVTKVINSATSDHISNYEMEELVLKHLKAVSIPAEIGRWIRDTADGNGTYALQLAVTLRDTGILVMDGKKGTTPLRLDAPALSDMSPKRGNDHMDGSSIPPHLMETISAEFTSQVIDGLKKIPPIKTAYKSLEKFEEWQWNTLNTTKFNLCKVRKWGDPVMKGLGFDVKKVKTTNFQAVGLFNEETGFGAVTNYVYIERRDIENLWEMQFDEVVNGKLVTRDMKMNYLAGVDRGKIFMLDGKGDSWQKSQRIRWGTIACGGNLVKVAGYLGDRPGSLSKKNKEIKLPGWKEARPQKDVKMWRLAGFRKSDWKRPLDELLAEGLVHRAFTANKNNALGDSPNGIVYYPFFSPLDWDFGGTDKPSYFYLPDEYCEKENPMKT